MNTQNNSEERAVKFVDYLFIILVLVSSTHLMLLGAHYLAGADEAREILSSLLDYVQYLLGLK